MKIIYLTILIWAAILDAILISKKGDFFCFTNK